MLRHAILSRLIFMRSRQEASGSFDRSGGTFG
jgi:hypothetical protein